MKLIKAIAMTSISTVVKLGSGLVINKFISLYIGPSGLAIIGQFQNFSGIVQTFANGGLSNGVVKYTADNTDRDMLWKTALKMTLLFSIIIGLLLVCFSQYFACSVLGDEKYTYVFIIFGFTVCLFSINQLLLAIISGLKKN